MAKRVWLTITCLAVVGVVFGALAILSWMINETPFDRPSADFDRLTTQVESLPGVSVHGRERWVEAPTFSDPSSWIGLTVDEANLPRLLATVCGTEYPETVSWSLRIRADGGNAVSVHGETTGPSDTSSGSRCLDFGFDAVGLVGEVDEIVPGLELQPTIWGEDQFALVALDDHSDSAQTLLSLVAHADDLRDAAGLDSGRSVEINAGSLSLVIESDEHDRYLALLSDLVEEHGVTSFWADGDTQTDGEQKVQIVAPDQERAAIEDRIRASGLHIADFPVRFIPPDS